MRKFIIDTDTGSDDAIALIMALKAQEVTIEAVTTVCGNIPLEQATKNALMTIELTNTKFPPVYTGSDKPLKRVLETAEGIHGKDGMGDCNRIHPTIESTGDGAVEKIIEIVENNPGEIEIITIGPVTNIAKAIMQAPATMKKVKHIYAMATSGFGPGNVTPVAEFNVFVDAEAFEIMVETDIPLTIIGFDICVGEAAFTKAELELIEASEKETAKFAMDINGRKIEWYKQRFGKHALNLPDPAAMAVALWSDVVTEKVEAHCYTCTKEEAAYGQVIIDTGEFGNETKPFNATVIKSIDTELYKKRLTEVLIK